MCSVFRFSPPPCGILNVKDCCCMHAKDRDKTPCPGELEETNKIDIPSRQLRPIHGCEIISDSPSNPTAVLQLSANLFQVLKPRRLQLLIAATVVLHIAIRPRGLIWLLIFLFSLCFDLSHPLCIGLFHPNPGGGDAARTAAPGPPGRPPSRQLPGAISLIVGGKCDFTTPPASCFRRTSLSASGTFLSRT